MAFNNINPIAIDLFGGAADRDGLRAVCRYIKQIFIGGLRGKMPGGESGY